MTHGHELRGEVAGGNGHTRQRGAKREKLGNCISIITKTFLKNPKGDLSRNERISTVVYLTT